MADWLQLNDWLYDGLDSMLTTSLHGTLLADYAGFMALVLAATLACVSVLLPLATRTRQISVFFYTVGKKN